MGLGSEASLSRPRPDQELRPAAHQGAAQAHLLPEQERNLWQRDLVAWDDGRLDAIRRGRAYVIAWAEAWERSIGTPAAGSFEELLCSPDIFTDRGVDLLVAFHRPYLHWTTEDHTPLADDWHQHLDASRYPWVRELMRRFESEQGRRPESIREFMEWVEGQGDA
jgi:hypothetical protein